MNAFLDDLQQSLSALSQQALLRQVKDVPQGCVSFSDNDYLGLCNHPLVAQAASSHPTGGAASRLVSGNHPLYQTLETKLAAMKNTQAARVFTSGFSMNSSLLPALTTKADLIVADKLCHASLLDGAQNSAAKLKRFAHNDITHLERLLQERGEYGHCFIVTESVFSMDGDLAPTAQLLMLAEKYDCQLLVDDAHGFGVMPPLPSHPRLMVLGTLSKAVGSLGGYVCGSQILIDYITNHCRALIYTTALPPMVLAASLAALELMQAQPKRAEQAMKHAANFCEAMDLPAPQSPIVPYIVGDDSATLALAEKLKNTGYYVAAIRPPTVPKGTARLRFTFCARHTEGQVEGLIASLKQCAGGIKRCA